MLFTRTTDVLGSLPRRAWTRGAMVAAPVFAVRPFSASAPEQSRVSDAIIRDHREIKDHYDKIMRSKEYDEMTRHQNAFVWELARHSVGEEIVVYPAIEENQPDGEETAGRARKEYFRVKEKLYRLQILSADDPDFKPALQSLMSDLAYHFNKEEGEDLPRLETSLSTDCSDSMARSFERTKLFVPTRSHPFAPDKPPFETAVGLITAPIDKVMDAFRKFPKT